MFHCVVVAQTKAGVAHCDTLVENVTIVLAHLFFIPFLESQSTLSTPLKKWSQRNANNSSFRFTYEVPHGNPQMRNSAIPKKFLGDAGRKGPRGGYPSARFVRLGIWKVWISKRGAKEYPRILFWAVCASRPFWICACSPALFLFLHFSHVCWHNFVSNTQVLLSCQQSALSLCGGIFVQT